MTTLDHVLVGPDGLGADLLEHLEAQIESARRLLGCVLRQGQAIRARDVDETLRQLAEIQAETHRRVMLDGDRTSLLLRAGVALGIAPGAVTAERLPALLGEAADSGRARTAELRGLLEEIRREHEINRALMRQELTFLDHLTRLIGYEPDGGYSRGAGETARIAPRPPGPHRVLDTRA